MKVVLKITVFLCLPLAMFSQEQNYGDILSIDNVFELEKKLEKEFSGNKLKGGNGSKSFYRWLENEYLFANADGEMQNHSALVEQELERWISENQQSFSQSLSQGNWFSLSSGNWTNAGDGYNPGSGRANCIEAHPDNNDILFVGSASGGLWKTEDAGLNWTAITDGIPSLGVSAIAINPQNANEMYIMTGDGNARHTLSRGILKSSDGGNSWQPTGLTFEGADRTVGFSLEMHPNDPNRMIAAYDEGIYVTTDGWATWSQPISDFCYDIEFLPADPDVVIVSADYHIYRSSDGGDTFDSGVQVMPTLGGGNQHRQQLSTSPQYPSTVWVVGGSRPDGFNGLYRSVDGGLNWSALSTAVNGVGAPNILNAELDGTWDTLDTQANRNLALAVQPFNPNRLLVGGIMLWSKDLNGNNNWTRRTTKRVYPPAEQDGTPYVHPDFCDLKFIGDRLYACHDGGVSYSTDEGNTWFDITRGLVISQFYEMDSPEVDANTILSGGQDIGLNLFELSTSNDMIHVRGADGMYSRFQRNDPSFVYACIQRGNLQVSYDGGYSYSNLNDPGGNFITPIDIIANTRNLIYGGENGVSYYDDVLASWFTIGTTVDDIRSMSVSDAPNGFTIYYANFNSIAELTFTDNELSTLTTGGDISAGLPLNQVNIGTVEADPTNSDRVLVGFFGFIDGEKLYLSENKGATWTNISDNLPNLPITSAAFDPNEPGGIYVGTAVGVFYRNDAIGEWIRFNNGLPSVQVRDIDVIAGGQVLRAATFGRGLWESSAYTDCIPSFLLTTSNDPSNPNYTGIQFYQASQSIRSSRVITGGPGTEVLYRAGGSVEMETGFTVDPFCDFEVEIGPCLEDNSNLQSDENPTEN